MANVFRKARKKKASNRYVRSVSLDSDTACFFDKIPASQRSEWVKRQLWRHFGGQTPTESMNVLKLQLLEIHAERIRTQERVLSYYADQARMVERKMQKIQMSEEELKEMGGRENK